MTDMNEVILKADRRGRLRYTPEQKQALIGNPSPYRDPIKTREAPKNGIAATGLVDRIKA
jgi:hypothetical protein